MKFLIVGLGSMGKRRIRNLKALGMDLITGFDVREDRRLEAAEHYQIKVYNRIEDAMAAEPDALVISVPPDLHVQYAMVAINAGKPFFTEASVVTDGMEEMIKQMRFRGVIGFPSCTMRFFPGPRRIKTLVKNGAIGQPLAWLYHCGQYLPDWHPFESIQDFYVSKRETGGCREIVPFELVWLTDLFGAVKEITAQTGKISDLPCDIDDIYQLQIKHANSSVGSLIVDVIAQPAVRHIRILGSKGTLEWENSRRIVRVYWADQGRWVEESLGLGTVEKRYLEPEEPYMEELKAFIDCIKTNTAPAYTFEHDLEILKLLQAAEYSSASGQRIAF